MEHLKINTSNLPKSQLSEPSEAYKCSICKDQGYIPSEDSFTVVQCQCVKFAIRASVLGERFKDIDLGSLTPRNEKQRALKAILTAKPNTPVFIHGPVRCGKTHFLAAMYRYFDELGGKIYYTDDYLLKSMLRQAELDNNVRSIVDIVRRNDRFFIDDIGKSKMSESFRSSMFVLFNELYRNNKYLFITSNESIGSLGREEYLGPAIARRIEDICEIVEF